MESTVLPPWVDAVPPTVSLIKTYVLPGDTAPTIGDTRWYSYNFDYSTTAPLVLDKSRPDCTFTVELRRTAPPNRQAAAMNYCRITMNDLKVGQLVRGVFVDDEEDGGCLEFRGRVIKLDTISFGGPYVIVDDGKTLWMCDLVEILEIF